MYRKTCGISMVLSGNEIGSAKNMIWKWFNKGVDFGEFNWGFTISCTIKGESGIGVILCGIYWGLEGFGFFGSWRVWNFEKVRFWVGV